MITVFTHQRGREWLIWEPRGQSWHIGKQSQGNNLEPMRRDLVMRAGWVGGSSLSLEGMQLEGTGGHEMVYEFPIATVASDHKNCGLKQRKLIIL